MSANTEAKEKLNKCMKLIGCVLEFLMKDSHNITELKNNLSCVKTESDEVKEMSMLAYKTLDVILKQLHGVSARLTSMQWERRPVPPVVMQRAGIDNISNLFAVSILL